MTRTTIIKLFVLPLTLCFGACDREDTDNAEPNDEAVGDQADDAGRGPRGLARLDVDKDGFISQAEAKDHRIADKFAELDGDKDGKLSREELQAMKGRGKHGEGHGRRDPAERAAHMLSKFDADKDGSLSATELAEHPKLAGKFAEVDTDKDGKLSAAELTAFKAAHHGKGGGHGRGEGERGEHGPRGELRGEAQL